MTRKTLSSSLVGAIILLAPLIAMAQLQIPIPGQKPPKPLPAVQVLRINVDQTGHPACTSTANTVVAVVDDIVGNVVTVTFNDFPGSTTKQVQQYQSSALQHIHVRFCGQVHANKTDRFYASPLSTLTQLTVWPVAVSGCDLLDPSLATIF